MFVLLDGGMKMIKREGKKTKIENFSDLVKYVSQIDLESTNALIFTDKKGNRYRFVKKETIRKSKKKDEYHQMSIIEFMMEVE
jgi:hypothetical protein